MSFYAAQGAMIAVSVMIIGFILSYIFKLMGMIFFKGKEKIINVVNNDMEPFINEKRQALKEDKLLKLVNLRDSGIITEEEYTERSKKIKEN
jgi:hypothetical protein